jgi:3-oxoacyl-[acyl-carrier protein] reductase
MQPVNWRDPVYKNLVGVAEVCPVFIKLRNLGTQGTALIEGVDQSLDQGIGDLDIGRLKFQRDLAWFASLWQTTNKELLLPLYGPFSSFCNRFVTAVVYPMGAADVINFSGGKPLPHLIQIKESLMRLKGKVALITGGAAGIGKATAQVFAREGAKVVICDVSEELGTEVVKTLGPDAQFNKVDVANRADVQKWVDGVVAKYGRVDILINNAGITRDGQFVKVKDGELVKQMSEDAFDLVIAVNLKGVFNCAQAVAPYMIKQNSGVIINASSVVGLYGNFGQTNYVATKAAVIGMTKVWARELGKYNIRVNAVAPGFIMTDMVAKMPEEVLAGMRAKTPLGRLGEPEDIAYTYAWLSSDEAAYVHGTTISVDGGIVIGS